MRKEALIAAGLLYASLELSKSALTVSARKEAGRRDKWECQGLGDEPCYQASLNGGTPARYKDGFMITLAHYPEKHHLTGKGYSDPDPENARCLCTLCHASEEIDRGNEWGAKKLLEMGVYTWDESNNTGYQECLNLEEAKELREKARERQKEKDAIKETLVYDARKVLGTGGRRRV